MKKEFLRTNLFTHLKKNNFNSELTLNLEFLPCVTKIDNTKIDSKQNDWINCVVNNRDSFYFGTSNGLLLKFDREGLSFKKKFEVILSKLEITCLVHLEDDVVVAGCSDRTLVFVKNDTIFLKSEPLISNPTALAFSNGVLYVGLFTGEILKVSFNISDYLKSGKRSSEDSNTIVIDSQFSSKHSQKVTVLRCLGLAGGVSYLMSSSLDGSLVLWNLETEGLTISVELFRYLFLQFLLNRPGTLSVAPFPPLMCPMTAPCSRQVTWTAV